MTATKKNTEKKAQTSTAKKETVKAKDLVRSNVNKGVATEKDKRSGVLQTMINLLTKKAHSKDTLLVAMCKAFPEREPSAMMATIKSQFSGKENITRMERERGIEMTKTFKNTKGTDVTFYQITSFEKDWSNEEGTED